MIQNATRHKILLILSVAGLGIAVLSALEGRVEWLASLCGFWGDGCRETAQFNLLGITLWVWGAAFYAALTAAILFYRPAVFWLVMIGFGVEISLAWIMATMKLACVFCLLNLIVVVLLVVFCLHKNRLWQTLAVSLLVFIMTHFLVSGELPATAQEAPPKQSESVIARVGDETITVLELESPLATKIYKLEHEIYELKHERLEELIEKILLRKMAEKKGISMQRLIDDILGDDVLVSDREVDQYYWQNQSRLAQWPGSQAELKERIRDYLQSNKNRRKLKESTDPLRDQYPVTVHLAEPPLPFSKVSVGDSPVSGPADAAVTIVEFSDYLCPACRAAHETTQKIRQKFAGKIRWVFKDYPLKRHQGAKKLAEAAHCAEEQGRFWEFQDQLFASRDKPDQAQLKSYAEQLGLDIDRFTQCLESERYLAKVERNIEEAKNSGVSATPSFVINGRLKPGSLSLEDFTQIIEEELHKTSPAHAGLRNEDV